MHITVKNIVDLIEQHGINANQLSIECGLNNSAMTEWKKGKSKPSEKKLQVIADYFKKPLSYFYEDHTAPQKAVSEPKVSEIKYPDNLIPEDVIMFPIIGTIAAGYDGNVSFDPTGDEIPVPKYLLKTHNPDDYFVLHVVGDSMLPAYHNGDKVLIRKTDSVDSGTIAAVGFDTENATLKKVEYIKGENWMKLIPLNPDYPVKEIKDTDLDLCHVYGEVVYKFDNRTHAPDNDAFTAQFNSLSAEQQKTILTLMNSMLEKK